MNFGDISYELRTPVTNIIGFTAMLASPTFGDLNDKQREQLDEIMTSSKRLLSLVDDMLDLATIDAGVLQLKLTSVGVRDIIDTAILGIRERAICSRLTIDVAVADDVTQFTADEARMRQILYNLLSNAVDLSKLNSTIRLTSWREDGNIVFAVEDEGAGIPKDQMSYVFKRFESNNRVCDHRGTGLGLSIVRSLVELHGGMIDIASEQGSGTRVTVRMPDRPPPT